MRKYLLSGAVFLSVIACNNPKPEATTEVAAPVNDNAPVEAAVMPAAKLDPVCEMVCDTSWTEYSVYMGDTVKFCSEHCKTAFVARPEKYFKGEK